MISHLGIIDLVFIFCVINLTISSYAYDSYGFIGDCL